MIDILQSTFVKNYVSQMVDNLKLVYPNKSEEELRAKVLNKIKNNPKLNSTEEIVTIENNYTKEVNSDTMLNLIDYILDEKPILTAYGTLFKQHKDGMNLNADFVRYLKSERKVAKKNQFDALNIGDKIKEAFYEMLQKTFKLLNNSYYGINGEPSSFFFNEIIPPSVTYQGYAIITTSIMSFEMFLANNYKINDFNELMIYITRCLNKPNVKEVLDLDKCVNLKTVANHINKELITFKLTPTQKKILQNILISNKDKINNIYYTNNLYEFLSNSKPKEMVGKILNETITNYNDVSDETREIINELYGMIKKYITYDYQTPNRADTVFNMNRKAILGSDTDSNFVSLHKFYEWVEVNFGITPNYKSDNLKYATVANTIIAILARYIQDQFNILTGNCNLTEENQPIINMKSEFLFPKMLFTRNKKQYSSLTA